jgi:hypothetical protein
VALTFIDLPQPAVASDGASATAPDPADEALGQLFATDMATRPLISDNANDLLDGVLNDVMSNLNEEGNAPK